MTSDLRNARRAEIDSDLSECQADLGSSRRLATAILLRVLRGVPNDLLWRLEWTDRSARLRRSIAAVAGAVAALVLTVLWMGFSLLNQELPKPAPAMSFIAAPRPPPPPPPPPPDDYRMQYGEAARQQRHGIDR